MSETPARSGRGADDTASDPSGENDGDELTPVRFRGQIEGNYVGVPSRRLRSRSASATRFQMRIYRATIRAVEVLGDADTGDEGPTTPQCFYQSEIPDVRVYGIRPRSCLEGTIYDAAIEDPRITHFASQRGKTYGRIVGTIYGRFLLPPPGDPLTIEMLSTVEGYEEATAREHRVDRAPSPQTGGDAPSQRRDPGSNEPRTAAPRDGEPLHPPLAHDTDEDAEPPRPPLWLLTVGVAIALGLTAGWVPSLIWLAFAIPVGFLRFMLHGMFRVTDGSRVFGAVVVLLHYGCLGALVVKWWSVGCKSEEPLYMLGLIATMLLSSVLPSPASLLGTSLGVAATLWLWFGNVGTLCEPGEPTAHEQRAPAAPSVKQPGAPRTNDDGSWPRRPSGD